MPHPLEFIQPKSLKRLSGQLQSLIKGRLWLKILIGMALGIGMGTLLGPSVGLVPQATARTIGNWVAIPGQVFLLLIQMIVVPLVFASVILGIAASENMDQLRKMGFRIAVYFVLTTSVAITIGISVGLLITPGQFIPSDLLKETMKAETSMQPPEPVERPTLEELPDAIVDILPRNPLRAMVGGEMLQVVLFAIIFGLALVTLAPKQAKPLLSLLGSLQEVCMTVVKWAMLIAPIAVFGLLAQITTKIGIDVLLGMGVYVGTVLLGLILLLCLYLLIVSFISGRSPWSFLKSVRDVQLLAFSTSSSAAVMPLSIKTAEEKLGVKSSISQFLVPLGATVNMDGTALYQGVATVFLAQVFGVELGMDKLLLVIITTVGASIGSPATPGVGIVILATVLTGAGIPPSGIALIIGVDRILDMSRTAINVTGDLTACTVMNRWVGGEEISENRLAAERSLGEIKEGGPNE
ncbi:MAG: dicarboxylate/amino acid:cation symporter [Candidatus Zixiibacteriota bacterium]|nr:MAG: dicarboxylate/amino acid:cation symporter [candidate division Zixibacteria bacterium]